MVERFHAGELAVQAREGAQSVARRVSGIIGETFPPAARELLAQQRMLVVASVSPEGNVWGSLLTGEAGFLQVLDARTLQIGASPPQGDPLHAFERGGTLQLTGEARAAWEPARLARFPGARRVVEFRVAHVREVPGASPLRWSLLERSRFNPI